MDRFKSGQYISQGTYKSFQPEMINRAWCISDITLIKLLSEADQMIGRLDMFSNYIPNIDIFIRMHIVKEAIQSNKIEGTKTNMEEALLDSSAITDEKRDDWEEVQNYINAINTAILRLDDLPFSSRLIKEAHQILLTGVRGKYKNPGEFRRSQNWIGGASISDATFIPPVSSSINDLMNDLEKFAHNRDNYVPELIKVAILHYQFETIHPFLDGNGRVGRLIITIYLVEKGILKKPILYLSDFFERNRLLYYDNLMLARINNDITQWCKFFLTGVIEISKSSLDTFNNILLLKTTAEEKTRSLKGRAESAHIIIEHLFTNPIIDVDRVQSILNSSKPTAYKMIADLERLEILQEITGTKRSKVYAFRSYINLFN